MDADEFWGLIEESWTHTDTVPERTTWLEDRLRRLPAEEIIDFQAMVDRSLRRADTWDLHAAYHLVTGGSGGGDGYFYFLHWLIGQPRPFYDRVVLCADDLAVSPWIQSLADRPGRWSDEEYPWWEELLGLAASAYAAATGTELGAEPDVRTITGSLADPDTRGDQWDLNDPEELARRLPQLYRLAGPTFQVWPPRR